MKRAAVLLVVVEVAALALYVLFLYGWLGAKQAGPQGFPGSPDWGYLYAANHAAFIWAEGLCVGIGLCGALLSYAYRASTGSLGGWQTLAWVGLLLAVIAGRIVEQRVEASTQQQLHSNPSLERP